MSLAEVLPDVKSLSRLDKIRLIQLLAQELECEAAGLIEAGIKPLPVTWRHARRAYDIEASHADPFDRLLLAQSICEPLHLLTSDDRLARYSRELVITV